MNIHPEQDHNIKYVVANVCDFSHNKEERGNKLTPSPMVLTSS